MASVAPPRRFKVEPIETSTSSSKERKADLEEGSATPPRRFAPEPVETTTKSNRKFAPEPTETTQRTNRKFAPEPIETTTKSNRRFAPEPTETTQRSNRRFAPEPVETTTKTNRKSIPEPVEMTQRTNRKFVPQPVETTQSTNRKFAPEPIETSQKKVRRFAPEPVETSTSTSKSRRKFAEDWDEKTSPRRFKPEPLETTARFNRRQPPSPRKFTPQLIETAQRSRRTGDATPALLPSDKTEATPESNAISARKARILGISPTPPNNTPTIDYSQNPLFLEIRRAELPPSRRRSWFSCSQHSFRVPDLEPIESSESEASVPPSPSASPSLAPDHSFMYKEATRRRESVDDSSSGYLLALAAKAAESQLREQAMAAFPNDDFHEPVDHFIDHESEESESQDRRGSSYSEVNWDLKDMREYQGLQDYEKRKAERQAARSKQAAESSKPAFSPFGNPAGFLDASAAKKMVLDREVEPMRKGARPPMLGKNIKFPRCESPEPARFDPTQGCDAVRTAMCYLSEQSKAAEDGKESLWCGKGNGKQTSTTPSLWSTANSRASSTHGLWGGMCVNDGDKSPRGPTGILTPMHEKANPMSPNPSPAMSMSLLPPTPPASSTDFGNIDEKLAIEQTIEEEFGDDFVTQVYNYLSLGYPSMAQPFDPELSKISGIPVSELRQDDHLAKSRGYIRLGKDGNLKDAEITEETCTRWRALRTYIQEWARQHPKMSDAPPLEGHGVAVRKGSWGL
ncbi:uncharacterized protein EKO05_0001927 [Ascochyta rabiei]|uniref:Uncharacterized protein n=1 Tax=Didymella rabiei TaxID=5454 RepID=A0A163HY96_DIDRA|nr:uncharacterized protein EKO05_0001927 [Ascochyta rabiei]KZM25526.1 hypothetical protein ST47_g3309 [Ascochyta rabiei]UPX11317.1 hypothetical protein EKO05_0001927 [Ascochyta rabiei]